MERFTFIEQEEPLAQVSHVEIWSERLFSSLNRFAAGNEGLSLVLVSPNDSVAFDRMKAQSQAGMVRFPLEVGYLSLARDILSVAKKMDDIIHADRKRAFEKNWREKKESMFGVDEDEDDNNQVCAKFQFAGWLLINWFLFRRRRTPDF